jgi:hypothetical protein
MENKKRMCWLDMTTGKFSNSWPAEEHDFVKDEDSIKIANERNWKLIEYTCINDPDFEIIKHMKLR